MKKVVQTSLLQACLLIASTLSAHAFYDPGPQRWLNRDPILETGFVKLAQPRFESFRLVGAEFVYVKNAPVAQIDGEGLGTWHVCCRPSRGADGGLFKHCDLRDYPCDSPEDDDYPTQRDNTYRCSKMDNGKPCSSATQSDIDDCLKRNPYDAGCGFIGNNCQSNTRDRLAKCCLKSSWIPSWYAYRPRTGDPWTQYPPGY